CFDTQRILMLLTLALHGALPISGRVAGASPRRIAAERRGLEGRTGRSRSRLWRRLRGDRTRHTWPPCRGRGRRPRRACSRRASRSEEHTSELQSREKLVCRLLLG